MTTAAVSWLMLIRVDMEIGWDALVALGRGSATRDLASHG